MPYLDMAAIDLLFTDGTAACLPWSGFFRRTIRTSCSETTTRALRGAPYVLSSCYRALLKRSSHTADILVPSAASFGVLLADCLAAIIKWSVSPSTWHISLAFPYFEHHSCHQSFILYCTNSHSLSKYEVHYCCWRSCARYRRLCLGAISMHPHPGTGSRHRRWFRVMPDQLHLPWQAI